MENNFGPEILYEDNHLLIINKAPGDLVQGDKTGDTPLSEELKVYLKDKYNKPGNVFMGVAHRLDRPVSGIVIFARTGKALERLNEMFREKKIKKTYWAVVKNKPAGDSGHLVNYLKKNESLNMSRAYPEGTRGAQLSELEYKLIAKIDRYYLLEVNPLTGRHHQIRVQLSAIGCPIRGDVKYGYPRTNPDGSIHLHARQIDFIHPVQKIPLSIIADPPHEVIWDEFMKIVANK